jgi:sugar-specific transcriptional regulator TrmB
MPLFGKKKDVKIEALIEKQQKELDEQNKKNEEELKKLSESLEKHQQALAKPVKTEAETRKELEDELNALGGRKRKTRSRKLRRKKTLKQRK